MNISLDIENILSKLHCMIYSTTTKENKWNTASISESVECLTGWSKGEYLSQKMNWLDFIHPDDRISVYKEAAILLLEDKEITQEYRIIDRHGNIKYVHDTKNSQTINNEKVISGIVKDISHFKITVDKNRFLLNELIKKNEELEKVINSYQIINTLIPKDHQLLVETLNYSIENLFNNSEVSELQKLTFTEKENLKDRIINILTNSSTTHKIKGLSTRENEIAQLLNQGKRHKDIANDLNISLETVKSHAKKIRQKLNQLQ